MKSHRLSTKPYRWAALTGLAIASLALASCAGGGTPGTPSASEDAGEPTAIRVLFSHPEEMVPFEMRPFIAVDQPQYLDGTNTSLEVTNFDNYAQMPVLVNAGESADMANGTGISTVLPAWSQGAKGFRVIAASAIKPVYELVAGKDIDNIEGLDGATIGILGPNAAGTEAVDLLMEAAGLKGKYSTTIVGTGNAMISALEAGSIQAIPIYPPTSSVLAEDGNSIVGDVADVQPEYVTGVTIINAQWAEEHRDAVVDYLVANIKIGQWLQDPANKQDVIDYLRGVLTILGEELTDTQLENVYDFYITDERISFDGYADQTTVEGNLGVAVHRGAIAAGDIPDDLNTMFDWSYLNDALESLGLDGVDQYTTLVPAEING